MKTKSVIAAGALLASCALLTGCGLQNIGGPSEQDEISYDVTDKVLRLEVRSGAGDIVVTESDRTGVRVVESLYWRQDKPKTEHRVEGDALVLTYDCPQSWGSCGVNYRVEVPKGMQVNADTGSGNLTLRALSGAVEAETGSGDIEASSLGGKKMFAKTGSGNIELRYVSAPDNVQVETGSGDGTVTVPAGKYDVTTDTGSGDVTVNVTDDAASTQKISIDTGSGNAKVLQG